MEVFYYVAQWNSFSRAANHLNLSKGYVSKTIANLEKNLKIKLLNRTTRHVSLTSEGEMFLSSCAKVVEEKNYVLSQISNLQSEPSGLLTISASPTICESVLSKLILEFKLKFPKVNLNIDASPISKNLSQHGIDIALRLTNDPDENYVAKVLKSYKMVICATPEYFAKYGKPQKPEDFKNHHYLRYSNDPQSDILKIAGKNLVMDNIMSSNNAMVIKNVLLNSIGFSRLPEYYIKNELNDGILESVFDNDIDKNKLTLYAIYRSGVSRSNKVRAFLDFLNEYIGDKYV